MASNLKFDTSVNNLGLDNGVLGMIFTSFSLYEYTLDDQWQQVAHHNFALLEKKMISIKNVGFRHGIIGIGWGIESLSHLGYFNLNTDNYLEDFDNLAYRLTLSTILPLNIDDGYLGLLNYFIKRYDSKNFQTHRFKRICYQDCLVLISNRINDNIKELLIHNEPLMRTQIIDLCNVLRYVSSFYDYQINKPAIEEIIFNTAYILDRFCNSTSASSQLNTNEKDLKTIILLEIYYSYWYAGLKINSDYWYNKGKENFIKEFNTYRTVSPSETMNLLSVLVKAKSQISIGELILDDLAEFVKFINLQRWSINDKYAFIRYMIAFEKPKTLSIADLLYI